MKRVISRAFPNPLVIEATDIGQAIRAARTQAGLRLQDAALALGMAIQTLVDIEAGARGVSVGKILQAAQGLGVDFFVVPRGRRDIAERRLADLTDDLMC
jgi:transcriptional regulator with XRE-family HTH domain